MSDPAPRERGQYLGSDDVEQYHVYQYADGDITITSADLDGSLKSTDGICLPKSVAERLVRTLQEWERDL